MRLKIGCKRSHLVIQTMHFTSLNAHIIHADESCFCHKINRPSISWIPGGMGGWNAKPDQNVLLSPHLTPLMNLSIWTAPEISKWQTICEISKMWNSDMGGRILFAHTCKQSSLLTSRSSCLLCFSLVSYNIFRKTNKQKLISNANFLPSDQTLPIG